MAQRNTDSPASKTTDLFSRLLRGDWSIFRKSRKRSDDTLDLSSIGAALLSRRGEASGALLAQRLLDDFENSPEKSRLAFFVDLEQNFGAATQPLQDAIAAYSAHASDATALALHTAAEPRRQELIRRLNYSAGGTYRLIKMRETLRGLLAAHPGLAAVDADFVHLFTSWFNPGFLQMKPITWDTPARILEKLIQYEAVHAIRDWDDLRSRLDPIDRRCFGFFHPRLPEEPLIFVEVALSNEIPGSIQELLRADRTPAAPTHATTAVFYSISNTQKGLAGVPFGSFLLKHVIDYLKREIPSLNTFVTLSPVPGFAKWLNRERADGKSSFLDAATRARLQALDAPNWPAAPGELDDLRAALLAAASSYFLKAKTARGTPVDPVARFHLRNGAELHQLNFLGDRSEKGMRQSFGLMVNYLYRPEDIERNHEAFVERREIVASAQVRKPKR